MKVSIKENLEAGLEQEETGLDLTTYETLREQIHSNPELSGQESATASLIANHLRSLEAFTIYEKIGGHGVAAVLENGAGKTVLLRADMDALPILEQTDLPYASKVTQRDKNGILQPVMHACGHDIHVVSLLAAAENLSRIRSSWSGTLILVFQPAEESSEGAQAMVDDGLYSRIPTPDIVFGQHVGPLRAGQIAVRSGVILGAADSFKITFFGRGGHASTPDKTIDSIVMAASTVMRLQTIVSREINPSEVAVVTVGSIQAGHTENVIPDQAVILVNVRTVNDKTREKVLASIRRIVKAESDASGAIREPTVQQISRFPLTENNEVSTKRLITAFQKKFGKEDFDPNFPGSNASEDFSILATSVGKPYVYWVFGGIDPDTWDDAIKNGTYVPANHTPFFAPVIRPTLKVGMDALCTAALEFFELAV